MESILLNDLRESVISITKVMIEERDKLNKKCEDLQLRLNKLEVNYAMLTDNVKECRWGNI